MDPVPAWKHYFTAHSITEALEALSDGPAPALPVAGGTDLLLELQQGGHEPVATLVDLSRVPELHCLEVRGPSLFIGAAVPVGEVACSALVKRHAQAVAEACGLIGGPQVRNTATLGGNVAHALPAADGMIALLAHAAEAEIALKDGGGIRLRQAPLASLFRGPGQSALETGKEILTGFSLRLAQRGQASAFGRVMRPQGVALPILNVAVWLEREELSVRDIRIAVGPAGPVPQRAVPVEAVLRGAEFDEATRGELLARAGKAWRGEMRFRTSPMRATSAYRSHLSAILFERVFTAAWDRAGLGAEIL